MVGRAPRLCQGGCYPGFAITERKQPPTAKPNSALEAARESVAPERLLAGEDPASKFVEDAAHWIAVYSELLLFKERLVDTAQQGMLNLTEDLARAEVARTDLLVLTAERERFRGRLEFWKERRRELSRKRA